MTDLHYARRVFVDGKPLWFQVIRAQGAIETVVYNFLTNSRNAVALAFLLDVGR
jgi:hypothetical protein